MSRSRTPLATSARPAPAPRRRSVVRVVAGLTVLAAVTVVATACGSSSTADGRPRIVVTTTILGDLVRSVVGDAADVEVLMPPGADPHDYEPSAAQAAHLRRAALIVENGLGLESRVQPAIDAAERDGVPVLVIGDELDPMPLTDDPDVPDPHVWLDPDRMARAAEIVALEVAQVLHADDPAAQELHDNARAYAIAAKAAAAEAERLLATIPADQRVLITNHDALGYFARRFGLRVEGVVIPGGTTLAEPSAADLARLADVLRASGVHAIFSESTTSSKLPASVARAAGGDVRVIDLVTDTLGRPGTADATYAGLITELAQRIARGLGSS